MMQNTPAERLLVANDLFQEGLLSKDQFVTLLNAIDVVHFEKGMTLVVSPCCVTPLGLGTAAAVTLVGLAWIVARRNALAAERRNSKTFVEAVYEWLTSLIRRLFSQAAPQLPPKTELALPVR